ncbi:MAG: metal-dependent transcriptional regulator [Candidatus Eisenbacteria bacterium]|nr:metal-dependent transcriptional regulator [Candidatus Eisenbacteria bacterium]
MAPGLSQGALRARAARRRAWGPRGRRALAPRAAPRRLGALRHAHARAPRPRAARDAGRREALRVPRRHRILETFLVRVLGFDWAEVHADAEVLEHHISDRVLAAIDRIMGHPVEDPHGHPIPDRSGRVRRRRLAPLSTLPPGARAVVREIHDADGRRMGRWKDAGLVPGAAVRMREVHPLDDVFVIAIGRRRVVTGSEGLEGILVQPARRRA